MNARGPRTDLLRPRPSAHRLGRDALLALTVLSWSSSPVVAQTIRPVVVEYREKRAEGRFELVNDGLTPSTVVIEPRSFQVTDTGEPVYRPLDAGIHLRLSAMSLRIPPRQTRMVFYEATADSLPAWVTIACMFSGLRTRTGLEIRVELPHTVYLLQKQALPRAGVDLAAANYDAATHRVTIELENHTELVGRVLETQ